MYVYRCPFPEWKTSLLFSDSLVSELIKMCSILKMWVLLILVCLFVCKDESVAVRFVADFFS